MARAGLPRHVRARGPDPVQGGELPPGRHGLYFRPDLPMDALHPDGTPARDGVVPDIDLPRRLTVLSRRAGGAPPVPVPVPVPVPGADRPPWAPPHGRSLRRQAGTGCGGVSPT
ncbi:hypothetical protein AB0K18_00710 [Nonomuraea sp. NPDC049421]|uniref:hypothetical protein n=1 Tax=Nonomuraea sp. NPDC049421 TaxID=3155275 RepID=UPI0034353273